MEEKKTNEYDVLTPEEFSSIMKKMVKAYDDDPEMFHIEADDLMCKVLASLGYDEGVKVFEHARKWYA